ncbi:MAG: DUF1273 family protein [Clostridia bacterium]|nr:DUF1273 family protein [Clostridia bacterium]
MNKRCFFIGNRDADENIVPVLKRCIVDHIENKGVREFIVGQYGRFDLIVVKTISELKEKYPHIMLTLLIPYIRGEIGLPPGGRQRGEAMTEGECGKMDFAVGWFEARISDQPFAVFLLFSPACSLSRLRRQLPPGGSLGERAVER